MSKSFIHPIVLLAGLAAVCWIGAGYVGTNFLALAVTLLIGAVYLAGALELHRYRQATAGLAQAVTGLSEPPASLGVWLDRLPPSLRHAVRLRVEGERVALPAPALTPYLVGLLVLLGMLGTFLGMVATLKGTGMALEGAADLQAIRTSLAAPVKGLGFAFGTSIAGVATSAMLGLLSALCRRERIEAAQMLDTKIATTLRMYSQTYQREETLKLLQRQTDMMPALVDRLQTMMATMQQQGQALNERLAASQEAFHDKADAAYGRLAASMAQSLKENAAQSASAAGAAIRPAVEATMASLAREAASWHDTVSHAVQQRLDGLSSRFEATTTQVADIWTHAVAEHKHANEALTQDLRVSLDRFADAFEQRSTRLVENVSTRLEAVTGNVAEAWQNALSRHERIGETLASDNRQALVSASAAFEQHAASLLRTVDRSHADLQAQWVAGDQQRLAAWTETLGSMAATLRTEWEQAGVHAASRQQDICETLAQTAHDISSQTQAHARDTIAEIGRLVHAASEAPKAAADIIGELRQKLSDSLARDNAMLEERNRLLETLGTLLDAVNHASTEQRTAIDALVDTSATLLDRVGTRFADTVETETGKLDAVAAQVTGSAIEVASLGEAFGAAVQLFSQSNDTLATHMQRIATALDQSATRSDEQLAYYVAQAREVVDLSVLSQKQIIEDLQRLASQRASAGLAAA